MSLRINTEVPDFSAETTQGNVSFHDWIGDGWAILFSHPKDFTPVCTTELGYMAGLMPEFERRNCKIIGLSVDPVDNHLRWAKDIEETQGHVVNYPLIGDPQLKIAKLYDMLPEGAGDTSEGRSPADNATVRSVFVIGPDKKVKAMLTYPMTSGRNFDEVLRLLDSCQLTAKHQVATPVNWKSGEDVIIAGSVSDEQAREKYPGGWRAPKPYLRIVPQPHKAPTYPAFGPYLPLPRSAGEGDTARRLGTWGSNAAAARCADRVLGPSSRRCTFRGLAHPRPSRR